MMMTWCVRGQSFNEFVEAKFRAWIFVWLLLPWCDDAREYYTHNTRYVTCAPNVSLCVCVAREIAKFLFAHKMCVHIATYHIWWYGIWCSISKVFAVACRINNPNKLNDISAWKRFKLPSNANFLIIIVYGFVCLCVFRFRVERNGSKFKSSFHLITSKRCTAIFEMVHSCESPCCGMTAVHTHTHTHYDVENIKLERNNRSLDSKTKKREKVLRIVWARPHKNSNLCQIRIENDDTNCCWWMKCVCVCHCIYAYGIL